MAESTSVHIGENSPERIAYLLLQHVAHCEKRNLNGSTGGNVTAADRAYILDTYAECLEAIQMPHRRRND